MIKYGTNKGELANLADGVEAGRDQIHRHHGLPLPRTSRDPGAFAAKPPGDAVGSWGEREEAGKGLAKETAAREAGDHAGSLRRRKRMGREEERSMSPTEPQLAGDALLAAPASRRDRRRRRWGLAGLPPIYSSV
jgi:hypothetical protein